MLSCPIERTKEVFTHDGTFPQLLGMGEPHADCAGSREHLLLGCDCPETSTCLTFPNSGSSVVLR